MGSPEFVAAQRNLCQLGPDRFMAEVLERNFAHIDEWQTQMLVKALRVGSIRLFTAGLKPDDLTHTYVTPVKSVLQATLESVKTHQDAHVAVVPEGPYVIPVYRD
jgi:nickel-dependent lactate racemase